MLQKLRTALEDWWPRAPQDSRGSEYSGSALVGTSVPLTPHWKLKGGDRWEERAGLREDRTSGEPTTAKESCLGVFYQEKSPGLELLSLLQCLLTGTFHPVPSLPFIPILSVQ